MNVTEVHVTHGVAAVQETREKSVMGGRALEAMGAIAAIVLGIIGLAGLFSAIVAGVAAIVIGAAFLMRERVFTARSIQGPGVETAAMVCEGPSAACLGGLAGMVLGILSLFGIYPAVLLSVAVIIYGAAFLLSEGALSQLAGWLGVEPAVRVCGAGGEILVGMGAVVLGILGVIGRDSLVLVLAALLSLGVAALLSRVAISSRLFTAGRRVA
jgi:hypothetical protein